MRLRCELGSIRLMKTKKTVVYGEEFEVDKKTAETLLREGDAVEVVTMESITEYPIAPEPDSNPPDNTDEEITTVSRASTSRRRK